MSVPTQKATRQRSVVFPRQDGLGCGFLTEDNDCPGSDKPEPERNFGGLQTVGGLKPPEPTLIVDSEDIKRGDIGSP